jgi:hypothetical protein
MASNHAGYEALVIAWHRTSAFHLMNMQDSEADFALDSLCM